jgi:hypothetical protein
MALGLDGVRPRVGPGLKTIEDKPPSEEEWRSGRHGTPDGREDKTAKSPTTGVLQVQTGAAQELKREESNNAHERGVVSKTKPTVNIAIGLVHQWGFISATWDPSIVLFSFCLSSHNPLCFNAIGA